MAQASLPVADTSCARGGHGRQGLAHRPDARYANRQGRHATQLSTAAGAWARAQEATFHGHDGSATPLTPTPPAPGHRAKGRKGIAIRTVLRCDMACIAMRYALSWMAKRHILEMA